MAVSISYGVGTSLTIGIYLKACIFTKREASFLVFMGYMVNCDENQYTWHLYVLAMLLTSHYSDNQCGRLYMLVCMYNQITSIL